jgi:hypothetical protein
MIKSNFDVNAKSMVVAAGGWMKKALNAFGTADNLPCIDNL